MGFFCSIVCPFFTVLLSKFLLYSEVCLMLCDLLELFLCINYMYIFVFKVHSYSSGKICIHPYHVFFRDGINWSQTKVHNRILIQNHFTHIIDGSCSLLVIGIPCKNLQCKKEFNCSKLVRSESVALFWRVWIWDQEHK